MDWKYESEYLMKKNSFETIKNALKTAIATSKALAKTLVTFFAGVSIKMWIIIAVTATVVATGIVVGVTVLGSNPANTDDIATSAPETTTPELDNIDPTEDPNDQPTIDFITKKLEMFESVFKPDSHKWCIYDDVMGSSVTEVLAKQDLLIMAGCNEADILLAGQATVNLRILLEDYNDLRTKEYSTDYDKYTALYQYYVDHYDDLTQNFCDLYKTLKRLYENETVSLYISLRGKAEHYRQLVGQLYVVSTALDPTTNRDEETWQIDEKNLRDVIEDIHYFPDGNWAPEEVYWSNEGYIEAAHTLGEWQEEIPATTESAGTKAYYHCSVCEKNFDEDGYEITDLTIPKLEETTTPEETTPEETTPEETTPEEAKKLQL